MRENSFETIKSTPSTKEVNEMKMLQRLDCERDVWELTEVHLNWWKILAEGTFGIHQIQSHHQQPNRTDRQFLWFFLRKFQKRKSGERWRRRTPLQKKIHMSLRWSAKDELSVVALGQDGL